MGPPATAVCTVVSAIISCPVTLCVRVPCLAPIQSSKLLGYPEISKCMQVVTAHGHWCGVWQCSSRHERRSSDGVCPRHASVASSPYAHLVWIHAPCVLLMSCTVVYGTSLLVYVPVKQP